MIVITAVLPIDPASRDEAAELAADLAAASRTEDGVIDYRVGTDVENPNSLRFFEQYTDEEAVNAHQEADHYETFTSSLPDVLAGEPDITRFVVESATDVEV